MLRHVADVRRGEAGRAGLAFAVLLLIVGSFTIVKSVRDAVFLSRFTVTELSLVSIGLAALSGLIVSVYLRCAAEIARHHLVVGTHLVVAASLLAIAAGLQGPAPPAWLPWLLYGWSSVFGVFVIAQFWSLACDLFDVREAKRLFGLVGWGGVAGGLTGGVAARALAPSVGAAGLLSMAAAMFAAAALATSGLWSRRRPEMRASTKAEAAAKHNPWKLLDYPTYVRLLAGTLVVATVVTTLLDWQLKTVAKHAFSSRTDDLAAFFGSLHATISLGSLALQLTVAPWLFRRFGVGVGRSSLPAALLLGFTCVVGQAMFPVSLLALLTGVRLVEGATRFAITQPAAELSWLPLSAAERDAAKPFVDTVGDRLGTGLAGVVWIIFAAFALDRPDRVHWVGLAALCLVGVWFVLLRKTQRSYIDQIRSALPRRSIDLDSLRRSLGDEQTRRTLVESLESGDANRVRFALYLLESWELELPDLSSAIRHELADIRVQAYRLLGQKSCGHHRTLAAASLLDADVEVREAAVAYLRTTAPPERDPVAEGLVGEDPETRLIRWLIARGPTSEPDGAADAALAIAEASSNGRLAMIRLLGAAPADSVAPLLEPLLDDPNEAVVEAAIRAAGRARAASLVPKLARKLGERRWRGAALSALADIGSEGAPHLVDLLKSRATAPGVRRAIVRLAASSGATMADELVALLDGESPDIADEALRALVRLRGRGPVPVDAAKIRARVVHEATLLVKHLLFLGDGAWPEARDERRAETFLRRTTRDAVVSGVDKIVRLLSLVHEPADIQSAYRGLKSTVRSTRSKSIEYLDNLLDAEVKRVLLPCLEDADPERFAAIATGTLGLVRERESDAIERLTRGPDPWLRQVASWAVASEKEEARMGLSLVEKALKLRTVDVLERVLSEDLAHIAQIAEEVELPSGTAIYSYGDAPDALYIILTGAVRLYQDKEEIGVLGAGEAFGSWALFDEAPRVASAIAEGPVTVLKVEREEFLELLGDRVAIARAIFKAMVGRIRSLAELAQQR